MGESNVEREILDRLTRIEARQDLLLTQCAPCRAKVEGHEVAQARLDASVKSAHHRLDTIQATNSELKKELLEALKEQIASIYRTAGFFGGLCGFFVGVIMWIVRH